MFRSDRSGLDTQILSRGVLVLHQYILQILLGFDPKWFDKKQKVKSGFRLNRVNLIQKILNYIT